MIKNALAIGLLLFIFPSLYGQRDVNQLPHNLQRFAIEQRDTVILVQLRSLVIYPPELFRTTKEAEKYNQLVRDVKKVLPFAKVVYTALLETFELMEYMKDDKERTKHIQELQKGVYQQYRPILKTYNIPQGKLLLKLIDRECNQSSYELLKAFLGDFTAGFWNTLAGLFGASLKTDWDPYGKDAQLERICRQVEQGTL